MDTFYTGISFLKIHLMDVNDEYGQGHRCLRHLVRGRLLVRLWQRWWVEVPRGRFDRLSHSWLEVRTRLMSYCGDRIGRQTFAEPLNRDHQGLQRRNKNINNNFWLGFSNILCKLFIEPVIFANLCFYCTVADSEFAPFCCFMMHSFSYIYQPCFKKWH